MQELTSLRTSVSAVQAHKTPVVVFGQFTHNRRKPHAVRRYPALRKPHGEPCRMDRYPPPAAIRKVQPVAGVNHLLY